MGKIKIKFRAWDGEKMYYFDNHLLTLEYNDISGWNIIPNIPNYQGEYLAGESSDKPFELMQYTGLKDGNGKDIFEGDFIRPQNNKMKDFHRHIIFENGSFCTSSNKYNPKPDILMESIIRSRRAGVPYIIAGNIYENPELLK